VCTGKELTDNLLKQIEPFGATFHFGQEVTVVRKQDDGRFFVETSQGHALPDQDGLHRRRRGLVPAAHAEGRRAGEVRRHASCSTASRTRPQFAGKNLVIVGGGDSALDWALNFVQEGPAQGRERDPAAPPRRLPAAPASVAKMRELCDAYEMQFIIGQITGFDERRRPAQDGEGHRRRRRDPRGAAGHAAGVLRPEPQAGPDRRMGPGHRAQADRGRHREVPDQHPGIFAVGDINTYPGKKKLILSGFHEAALAAFGASPYRLPGEARAAAVHHHQPQAAQGAGRGVAGVRLTHVAPLQPQRPAHVRAVVLHGP
jgi:thioredoxin reductase (NADPH)